MERAAEKCATWIYERAPKLFAPEIDERDYTFMVFCGVGNNGGDGLVIARLLSRNGYNVEVYVVEFSDKQSPDFKANLKRLPKGQVKVHTIRKTADIPKIGKGSLLIDALFGTGISRKLEGISREVVQAINHSGETIVAIDMPSGLFDVDNTQNDREAIVKANHTLTLQFLKPAFLFAENSAQVGQWEVLDIGLHPDFIENVDSEYFLVENQCVKRRIKARDKFSHKGTFGHAAIVAGSYGKFGAALLASKGALKSGAGLVTAVVPEKGVDVLQIGAPEVMVVPNSGAETLTGKIDFSAYSAVGIGPGIGTNPKTAEMLNQVVKSKIPAVLDADALNLLSATKDGFRDVHPNIILTPHPGEFRRMVGDWDHDCERLRMQIEWSQKHNVYLLVKGAHSSLSTPQGKVYFNSTGNPGMATAGSGDVLTGVITGLLASGYTAEDAAIVGMYLHGKAGDFAKKSTGEEALTASDIISNMGAAFQSIHTP